MIIAVDFDGTCVTHEYPRVGKEIGAHYALRLLVANGHKIILNTMRGGDDLLPALEWFERYGIDLYGVNENPTQKEWTKSTKAYAHLYIDDAAFGCPLLHVPGTRPFVNWTEVVRTLGEQYMAFPHLSGWKSLDEVTDAIRREVADTCNSILENTIMNYPQTKDL